MKHKTGIILLIIGGICMLIGSVTGGIQRNTKMVLYAQEVG